MLTPSIRGVLLGFLAGLLLVGLFSEEQATFHFDNWGFLPTQTFLGIPNFTLLLGNLLILVSILFSLYSISVATRHQWVWAKGARSLWCLFLVLTGIFFLLQNPLLEPTYRLFFSPLAFQLTSKSLAALSLTTFFSILFVERQDSEMGYRLLPWFFAMALLSVLYLGVTYNMGNPDSRLYTFVTLYPTMVFPLLLSICPLPGSGGGWLLLSWILFLFAKTFEILDTPFLQLSEGWVSGAALYEFGTAAAIVCLGISLQRRKLSRRSS